MPSDLSTCSYAELQAWLRLALTPGVGNAAARRLLAQCGGPLAIFEAPQALWAQCLSSAQTAALARLPEHFAQRLERTWHWLHNPAPGCAHAFITLGDPRYPSALLHIEDPPLMLYAQGPALHLADSRPLTDMAHCLAMVGSRHPTAQGQDNARQFGLALAQQGWTVVSGLAAGIDAAAHEGALQAPASAAVAATSLVTVAVVGTGLDQVYPRRHQALAQRIAQRGLVLSEFPLGTPPIASNFPKRNRIIAGLSCGTLVVEAALASGSLITARLASEQGREVFAIPGSIHAPQARGCHALIRQGAKLVETAQDILEELQPLSPRPQASTPKKAYAALDFAPAATPRATTPPAPTPVPDTPLLRAMGYDPVGLDTLSARTGLDAASLQAQLLELELDGHIAPLPGGLFQRTAQA